MSLEIINLFYTYGIKTPNETSALRNINLKIEDGDFVAFVGETGSGKSTLVQNLNGLLVPTSGSVKVDDFVVDSKLKKSKKIKQLRKHIGLVFQFPEYQLFEETVEKDVAFGAKNFGSNEQEALEKAHKALLSVGLDESYFKRSPFDLSGGEKRRVAIAGILAIEPDILVLDEPTAGLDPKGVSDIMHLIDNLNKNGKTIILVTHDMDVVATYCKHVFVLNKGELVFSGTPNELFSASISRDNARCPQLYTLCHALNDKGFKLDINKIHNVDDFIKEYKGAKR